MSPDTFDPLGGAVATILRIAAWLHSTGREFLTISGGEPFDQAESLAALIDLIREDRPWKVTCYTGHRLEALVSGGDPHVQDLLGRLDLLIDGAYIEARHESLVWRGSANQRIHPLSGRVPVPVDISVGVDAHFDDTGAFRFIGVPSVPRFVETFVDLWPATPAAPDVPALAASPPTLPFPVEEIS